MYNTQSSGYGQTNTSCLEWLCFLHLCYMFITMYKYDPTHVNIHSWLPITLLISNTKTAKSDHAGNFTRKLHKKTLSKLDLL